MNYKLKILICFVLGPLLIFCQESILQQDFISPPELKWSFKTNGPIYSSPAIDNHILYVASTDSILYALDINNGSVLHKFKTGGDIRCNLLIHDNFLVLVSGDGKLYLLNKTDLSLIWSFSSRGDKKYELYSFADYFQSSPVIHNNRVYFGSGDGYVYALDLENGSLMWEFKTGGVVHSEPLVYDDLVYFGSYDGFFYALDIISGKLVWRFKSIGQRYFPKGEMSGSAIAFEKMIFAAGRDFNLYALDAKKGHGVWNKYFQNGWALAKPAVQDGVLFIGTSDDKALFALDPNTGQELWKTNVAFNVFAPPAFSENLVYVATLMGRIYAINRQSGSVVWTMDSKLYQTNHLNYFTDEDAYREDIQNIVTGENGFLKMYYALGAVFSKPLIHGNLMIIARSDGKVYSYERS